MELMNHGILTWDTVQAPFIGKIANQVNSISTNKQSDGKILINSLAILESIITSGIGYHSRVEEIITLPKLIKQIQQNQNAPEIQQNTIALINALFMKSDLSKKKAIAATLASRPFRNVIINSVLSHSVGSEMAHQLLECSSTLATFKIKFIDGPCGT